MEENKLLSIILLSYYSSAHLEETCRKISNKMTEEKIPCEIIIIDDGSKDNSFEIAMHLEEEYKNLRAYQLSRNYTSPYAQFAGFEVCRGACAVPVPDDLQRPLDLVVSMYRAWESGAKVVIGYRTDRNDGWISDWFSNTYYRLMNKLSNITFPPGGADGYLADREIIDLINSKFSHINTSPIIEVLKVGYDPVFIPYKRPATTAKSRWTFSKKWQLFKNNFFSTSSFPIRLITWIGLTTFLLSLVIIMAVIFAKIFSDNTLFGFPVQGWATLMVIVTMFNGLVLFCIGIVAEYIWRIYAEVKGRPGYIIKNK